MAYICLCADVNGIMLALDGQFVRRYYWCMFEFECVITWYRSSYDAPNNCKIACYSTTMTMICTNVDSIYGTVSCWLWTNRKYVGIGACLNLKVSLLTARCNMTPSHLQTHLLLKYTAMAMTYGYALMLILIERMEWCHAGFGQTDGTLVLVHVWIRMCHYLVNDALYITPSQLHTRLLLFKYTDNDIRLLADVDWMYGTVRIVLAFDEQNVRWYWCMFEFECVNAWYTVYSIKPVPPVQHKTITITHLLCKHTTLVMAYGSALMLIEYMERHRVGFGRIGSTLVLVRVWIWMCHYLVYNTLWHDNNYTLACYSITLQC